MLFAALDLSGLTASQRQIANRRILITSNLFGVVRPLDRICSYRLPPGSRLPELGSLSSHWRPELAHAIAELRTRGLGVDLRSGPYVQLAPNLQPVDRITTIKIWQRDSAGERVAVSHANKHAKGLVARCLATAVPEPLSRADLVDCLESGGFSASWAREEPRRLDITI